MKKKETKSEPKELTLEEIDIFEKVNSQLKGLHSEIGALSSKAQNDAVNKFKLKFINQILKQANKLLGDKYRPFPDFNLFDENELPTNSDITFIVSQYLGCMEKLRVDNITCDPIWEGNKRVLVWYWNETEKLTYSPLNIKDK